MSPNFLHVRRGWLLSTILFTSLLSACASHPARDDVLLQMRDSLDALRSNEALAPYAESEIQSADVALHQAEQARDQRDPALDHLIAAADSKLAIAWTHAEKMRGQELAQTQVREQTAAAERARAEADAQRRIAAVSTQQVELAMLEMQDYRRQLSELQTQANNQGLVVTLNDVLFSSGRAELQNGARDHLNKLAAFLQRYPHHSAIIKGYTDSYGSAEYNQRLSQLRADQVRAYLMSRGVASERITAVGKGKELPIASNQYAAGRQQNRRVEFTLQATP